MFDFVEWCIGVICWFVVAVIVMALIFAAFVGICTLVAPIGANAETYYCVAERGLNCRFARDKNSSIEATLEYGDAVEVISVDGDWAEVMYGDVLYCWFDYLSPEPPVEEAGDGVIRSNGRVALRKAPDGDRVGWLNDGDKVSVTGRIGAWVRTTKGYVKSEFVEVR